jgi:hypothetical protein
MGLLPNRNTRKVGNIMLQETKAPPAMTHRKATFLISRLQAKARDLGLVYHVWENSTRTTGVRTARLKIVGGDQRIVNKLVRYAKDLVYRSRAFRNYTNNVRWERRAYNHGKRITNNCFTCWYISDGKRHTAAIAK